MTLVVCARARETGALALALASRGCHVVVTAKSVKETEGLAGTIYSVAEEIEAMRTGAKALPFQLGTSSSS